ncbi:MAG: SRPBCC family protein [Actinomycetota bacterium]
METVERSIDVDVPLDIAYEQCTRFEDFAKFMQGVESVTPIDGGKVHWVAQVAGKRREWNALFTEWTPRRISWIGFGDPDNVALVSFERLEGGWPRTRVTVRVEYEPERLLDKVAHWLGIVGIRLEGDLLRFKEFTESRRIDRTLREHGLTTEAQGFTNGPGQGYRAPPFALGSPAPCVAERSPLVRCSKGPAAGNNHT